MHFAGIDVPQELVTAHVEDSVVFFVGAGASMTRPTSLPDFRTLARRVAARVGVEADDSELVEPDLFLGRLGAERRVPVHRLVEQEIRKGRGQNALHGALAALSSAGGTVRMVTTNYDDYLHRALKRAHLAHTVFEAPALPAGYDFEGLVHLHGRLGQPPERWVVTDSDFGSAYITRGWAPAFLRDLFATYVVCFVGYSHEDRMMEYLAKGLPSDARPRFILTDKSAAGWWERLGLTPVPYPAGQHQAVVDTLVSWCAFARDTPLDRAARIRSLAGEAPPADPDDHDFLVASMEQARLAAEICDISSTKAWIEWLFEQRPVRALLGRTEDLGADDSLHRLAGWIAAKGVDPEWFEDIYDLVASDDGGVDQRLTLAILWQISHTGVEPLAVSTWLRWLLARTGAATAPSERLELLWASEVHLSWPDTMLMLDRLANTWTLPAPSLFSGSQIPRVHLDWGFQEGSRRLMRADRRECAELLRWLTAYLEQAHLRTTSAAAGFDPWAFSRSSIAAHPQDGASSEEPEHVIVNCARDLLASLWLVDADLVRSTRIVWLSSRTPLLQRLALHDLAAAPDVPVDEQVAAVLADERLFDSDLHHEIYELVAAAAPALTDTAFSELLEIVSAGPTAEDEPLTADPGPSEEDRRRWRDRKVYNLLQWLVASRPGAKNPPALDELQVAYPEWRVDEEHADFAHYITSGSRSIEDDHPWTPDAFHAMLAVEPRKAVDDLLATLSPDTDHFWWGGGDMVGATVAKWPDDGLLLWPETPDRVRGYVIAGWSKAPLSPEQMDAVMTLLADADLAGVAGEVARMLHPWAGEPWARERWLGRTDARSLARRALAAWSPPSEGVRGSDLYHKAINSTPGTLSGFWIAVAAAEARAGTFPVGGLTTDVSVGLEELLRPSPFRRLVLACLLEQLDFLFRADPEWATAHLLASIDPRAHPWADIEAYWSVVLRGRVSEPLLEAALLDWLVLCAERVEVGSKVASDLTRMASLVAVQSSMGDAERIGWVKRFIAGAPVEVVARWTTDVARLVASLEPDARTSLWTRWMRTIVVERIDGAPRSLTDFEATALTTWVALLPQPASVHDGVDLLISTGRGFEAASNGWSSLRIRDEQLKESPDEWARLLGQMLCRSAALTPALRWQLDSALGTLQPIVTDPGLLAIIRRELFRLSD